MRWARLGAYLCLSAIIAWQQTRAPPAPAPAVQVGLEPASRNLRRRLFGSEGDLEAPGLLERALSRYSALRTTKYQNGTCRQREIIFMLTDDRHIKWAHNLLLNLRDLHITHTLVIASNAAVCKSLGRRLRAVGSPSPGCAHSSYLRNGSMAAGAARWGIGDQHVFHLWWQRWRYTSRSVGLGYNVLFLDTDITVRADPYPLLQAVYSHRQLLVGIESDLPARSNRFTWPAANVGFLYTHCAEPNGAVHWLLSEVARRFEALLLTAAPIRHVKSNAIATNLLWEQDTFRDVLENMAFGLERSSARHARYHSGDSSESLNRLADSFDWQHESLQFFSKRQVLPGVWLPLRVPPSEPAAAEESVAGLPLWFFAAYGLEAHGNVLDGSWAQIPSPMIAGHFVFANKKNFLMRLLGVWHYAASAPSRTATASAAEPTAVFPDHLKVLVLRNHGIKFTQADHAHGIWRSIMRFVMLALAAGRRAVLPLVPCSSKRWLPRMPRRLLSELELVPLGNQSLCTDMPVTNWTVGIDRPRTGGWFAPPQPSIEPTGLLLEWPRPRNWSFVGCCQPLPSHHMLLDEVRRTLQEELVLNERDLGQLLFESGSAAIGSRIVRVADLLSGGDNFTLWPLLTADARVVVLDVGASESTTRSLDQLPSIQRLAAECMRSLILKRRKRGAPRETGVVKFHDAALSFCKRKSEGGI